MANLTIDVPQTVAACGPASWMRTVRQATTGRVGALMISVALVPALVGCSSVPDAINPVAWYDGVFSDDEDEDVDAAQAENIPGEEGDFPNLASVPDRPQARADGTVAEGLIADPNRPKYAPAIRRQGEAELALEDTQSTVAQAQNATSAAQQGALQPAPPALPAEPVAAAAAPPPEPMAVGDTLALTPPPEPGTNAQLAQAGQARTPLPAILADNSSQAAFDAYRQQLRTSLSSGGQVAPFPARPGPSGSFGQGGQQGTVVVSSSGVESVGYGYGQQTFQGGYDGGAQPSLVQPSASGFRSIDGQQTVLAPGSVKVATILFNNGSANLDGTDAGILRQVADLHRQRGGFVRVIGHASSRTRTMDPVRHKMVNYQVSAGRADAVAKALVRMGVPREAILVGAVADAEPLFYEVMPSGEAGNRRTEVYIDT